MGSEGTVYPLELDCIASFHGSFGVGANAVLQEASMQALFDNKAIGAAGLPLLMELTTKLDSVAFGGTAMVLFFRANEGLLSTVKAGADISPTFDIQEDLSGEFVLGADLPARISLQSDLIADLHIGADYAMANNYTAILSASVSVVDISEEMSLVLVDLAPGDELRIDSENYTVTLNGDNILHLQEGDWVRLNRDMLSITIDSGTAGALSGSLICEERWL